MKHEHHQSPLAVNELAEGIQNLAEAVDILARGLPMKEQDEVHSRTNRARAARMRARVAAYSEPDRPAS